MEGNLIKGVLALGSEKDGTMEVFEHQAVSSFHEG